MNDNYQNLANAIVLQAVKDYRNALKKLKKNPHNGSAIYMKRKLELFFCSDYYNLLTNVNGELLISKLKEEVKSKEVAI